MSLICFIDVQFKCDNMYNNNVERNYKVLSDGSYCWII